MSEASLNVRPAHLADASSIAAILRDVGWFDQSGAETPADTGRRVAAQLAICQAGDRATVLVAEEGEGQVVGYVAAHWMPNLMGGLEAYVSELFVLGAAQGRGVGSRLLRDIEGQARERGCTRLLLFNRRIRESYRRRFYVQRGWVEREDVACFMRFLGQD